MNLFERFVHTARTKSLAVEWLQLLGDTANLGSTLIESQSLLGGVFVPQRRCKPRRTMCKRTTASLSSSAKKQTVKVS